MLLEDREDDTLPGKQPRETVHMSVHQLQPVGAAPRVSDPVTRDGIQIFVLLTRWQVTLRLLVQDHTVRTTVVEKLLNM